MEDIQSLPGALPNDSENIVKNVENIEKTTENEEKSEDIVEIQLSEVEIVDLFMGKVEKRHLNDEEENAELRLSQEEIESILSEDVEEEIVKKNYEENNEETSQFQIEIEDMDDVDLGNDLNDLNAENTLNMDFEVDDMDDLEEKMCQDYIKAQQNENTAKKTESVMNKFREWLLQVKETRHVLEIHALKLNKLVGLFLVQLTKEDGSDMEPDTITSYHRGIDRYLKENKYPERILTSDIFESSRVMLGAKRKELIAKGLGNRPNRAEALSDTMIEKHWETGELGCDNARSLQNTVFFYLTQGFGFRGCDESRQMEWGDITIKTSEKGEEYLEFKERITKTRQGGSISGCRAYAPKIFAVGGERCPVQFYKMYSSHRPEKMLSPDSPFYLGVKTKKKANENVWYTCQPMGKNTISKIVPSMAKAAGIEGKIVNHSLRKQTCQTLLSNYVPDTMICELTGHKNVGSLRNYTTANLEQQKAMSDILCHSLGNEKRKIPEISGSRPNKMICLPSSSNVNQGNAVACEPEKKPENALEKLIKASSGILSGATIHGNINLNINYHVSSSQSMNLSPKSRPAIE